MTRSAQYLVTQIGHGVAGTAIPGCGGPSCAGGYDAVSGKSRVVTFFDIHGIGCASLDKSIWTCTSLRGQNPRVECLLPCPSPQRHNGAQEFAPRVACSDGTAGRKRADRVVRGVDIHHRPLEQPRRDPVHTRRSATEPRRASWPEGASPAVHWSPANVAPTRVRARTRPPSTNLLEPLEGFLPHGLLWSACGTCVLEISDAALESWKSLTRNHS